MRASGLALDHADDAHAAASHNFAPAQRVPVYSQIGRDEFVRGGRRHAHPGQKKGAAAATAADFEITADGIRLKNEEKEEEEEDCVPNVSGEAGLEKTHLRTVKYMYWGMDLGFKNADKDAEKGTAGPPTGYSTFNCRLEKLEEHTSAWHRFLGHRNVPTEPETQPEVPAEDNHAAADKPKKRGRKKSAEGANGAWTRKDYPNHRCVVLVQGYYEWQKKQLYETKSSAVKLPFYVSLKDRTEEDEDKTTEEPRLMLLAALHNRDTVAVITRPADPALEWLHDRAPVILATTAAAEAWLTGCGLGLLAAQDERTAHDAATLQWRRVGQAVGSVTAEDSAELCRGLTQDEIEAEDAQLRVDKMPKSKKRQTALAAVAPGKKARKMTDFFKKAT